MTTRTLTALASAFALSMVVAGSAAAQAPTHIEDPVGAISVHLTCGIWGTLAVGIFSTNPDHSFLVQLAGVAAYGVATLASAFVIFGLVKATMGLRVSEEEEIEGLDYGEHGMHAYDLGLGGGAFEPHGTPGAPKPAMAPFATHEHA